MSDTCPTCSGDAEINQCSFCSGNGFVEAGGQRCPGCDGIGHVYRSTAAEQLEQRDKEWRLQLQKKLLEHEPPASRELTKRALADKERELTEQKQVEALCIEELLEAEQQLAATNAVVEAADKTIDALCHELATWETDGIHKQSTIDRREKAILRYRKLQGGGSGT